LAVFREFLALRQLKDSTVKEYERAMSNAFADWSTLSVTTISEEMILQRYADLSLRGKTTASRHMRFFALSI
jgi:hypothetical protein